MRRCTWLLLMAAWSIACGSTANVAQERETLLKLDSEWSQSTKDVDKFITYYAADASTYPPGMPVVTGTESIKKMYAEMSSAPGFSLQWTAMKADVGASGDIGYTTGTYESTMNGASEKGKYVTIWKKENGQWKVAADIFNSDAAPSPPPTQHVMVAPASLKWGDPPPALPVGAKVAVVSGDPSQAGPFVLRLQVPAGYKVAPHWHPTAENVTILSGTAALGMGDAFDESKLEPLGPGGYAAIPGEMHHFFVAKTAATLQVHGTGPFAITYVNAADDPRKKQ